MTLDRLERLQRSQFTQIELHASLPGFNYAGRSATREIARWFHDNELPAPSLHLPFEKNILSSDRYERQAALDELRRCLEFNDLLQVRFAVLHLGEPGQQFNPVAFEYAYAAVATIQSFAGVRVLLETLRNGVATFARLQEFKTVAQLNDVGICYDTGHGEMDGECDAIHLDDAAAGKDNDDEHLWPFDGTRNWPALVERLVLTSYAGPLILECSDDRLEKAADCRSRLKDLMGEAANSIEEFRLKYKLPSIRPEEER